MSEHDPYVYPGSAVLRNRLNILDAARLETVERELVAQRIAEGATLGDFDLAHLRAIHRHLFQDLYAWAGEVRKVEIAKDGQPFQFRQFIEIGMADVHRRLQQSPSCHASNLLQLNGDPREKPPNASRPTAVISVPRLASITVDLVAKYGPSVRADEYVG